MLDVHAHKETTPSLVIVKKETRAARPHKEVDVHISQPLIRCEGSLCITTLVGIGTTPLPVYMSVADYD